MDRYKIQKRIGKGSFGSVFLVTDLETQQDAVVKRVPLVELSDKERGQAKLEVQLMQSLSHPFLVAHIDSFLFNEEDLVIVMEFYRGGDLGSFLSSRASGNFLPEIQVVNIVAQLALGLQFMHSRRVLHRDIKAQNVFLTSKTMDESTNILSVVIGDLGIAKVLGKTLDMAKTAIGTPLYMSPEVCEGEQYSYSSDVWSLGCVFYELAALHHPFQSRDLSGLVMKILTANYSPLPPDVKLSKPYRDMLKGMLSKNPKKRPSADDILQSKHFRRRAVDLGRTLPEGSQRSEQLQAQLTSLGIVGAYTNAAAPASPSPQPPGSRNASPARSPAGRRVSAQHYDAGAKGRIATPPPSEDANAMRSHLLDRYNKKKQVEERIERLKNTASKPGGGLVVQGAQMGHLSPSGGGGGGGGGGALSAKERVLRQKREREQKQEEDRLRALEAARSDTHQQRRDAKEAEYNMYHSKRGSVAQDGGGGATPPLSNPSSRRGSPARSPSVDIQNLNDEELDGQILECESEVALYRKQIGEILCKLDDPTLLQSVSNNHQMQHQQQARNHSPPGHDPFDDFPSGSLSCDDDSEGGGGGGGGGGGHSALPRLPVWGEESQEEVPRDSVVITGLSEKIRALRVRLEQALTKEVLQRAYSYIKDRNPEEDASPDFYPALRNLLPNDKVHLWVEIDQLIFMESSFGL